MVVTRNIKEFFSAKMCLNWLCLLFTLLFIMPPNIASAVLRRVQQDSILLKYFSNTPVDHCSNMEMNLTIAFPDRQFYLYAQQTLESEMMILGKQRQSVNQFPFDIQFSPKAVHVSFNINDTGLVSYDMYTEKSAMPPLVFSVDSSFLLKNPQKSKVGLQDLPLIHNFASSNLYAGIFDQLLALGGKGLAPGFVHHEQLGQFSQKVIPMFTDYTIIQSNPNLVRATIEGKSRTHILPMAQLFPFYSFQNLSDAEDAKVVISGVVRGCAQWDASNAMIYQTRLHYIYSGNVLMGNQSSPFTLDIAYSIDSYEKE